MTIYSMLNEPLQPSAILQGRYTITHLHRLSGMSALYLAHALDGPFASTYAIKEAIVQDSDPLLDYDPISEFERLGAALMTVSHPAIPAVFEYFVEADRTYLVTEFVEGQDIETLLNRTAELLPVRQVYEWALTLADALNHLHTRQPDAIVYRDVKPANIMLAAEGDIRLVDFGIAVAYSDPPRAHPPLGTDGYAAPEQYVGDAHPLIDVYGLGATLHQLLTGFDPRLEPPFSFDRRPIHQHNPAVPDELAGIVEQAVMYNAWERFSRMDEMLAALQTIGPLFED